MDEFVLCRHCLGRNGRNRRAKLCGETECFVCRGLFLEIESLVSDAVKKLDGVEWKTFSVSSAIPREVLIREEEVLDYGPLSDTLSIKNELNGILAKRISSATGKKQSALNPDISIEFDFAGKTASVAKNPLFVFGRYNKFSRNISQSKWHCKRCGGRGCKFCGGTGRMYVSIEEILSSFFIPKAEAMGASFHAAGREDIDARMLGNGRPFILELKEPKKRSLNLKGIEKEVNGDKRINARDLAFVRKEDIPLVTNSRFDKDYCAILDVDKKISKGDVKKIKKLEGRMIAQKTPMRVIHRRADIVRKRRIKKLLPTIKNGRIHLFLTVEAGTYVKEFINGDGGRTKPSISTTLGCRAECKELDVLKVHDDILRLVLC